MITVMCVFASAAGAERKPYEGSSVVSIDIGSTRDLMTACALGEMLACFPGPGPNDFIVEPGAMQALRDSGLRFEVRTENLQAVVDEQTELNATLRADRGSAYFDAFRTLDEVNAFMDELDNDPGLPADQVQIVTIGTSIQGRAIRALRISSPPGPDEGPRPVFVFNSGQHAREWITVPASAWAAERLVRDYATDEEIRTLVDSVVFYIVPVLNPDGYVHTWPVANGGGGERYWRKNRRLNSGGSFGVDLNRNWGHQWGGGGSSSSQTSDTYRGTGPFSEPETAAMRDFMTGGITGGPLKAYIDIHSFSQLIMSPWGYTSANPPRLAELQPVTNAQVAAVEAVYGTNYTGGPIAQVLYTASGNSADWVLGDRNALAWAYELRPSGGGVSSFAPSPSEILPTAIETWEGLKVVAHHIRKRATLSVSALPAPLSPTVTTPVSFSAAYFNAYQYAPNTARVFYREAGSGAPFAEAAAAGGPSAFTGMLPTMPCGSALEYYIEIETDDGFVTRFPSDAANSVLTAEAYPCPCAGDASGDNIADFTDLVATLARWGDTGAVPGPPALVGDANGDGVVDFDDLVETLANWLVACN